MLKTDYRRDIDGLRAIAVLLVTIFHINEKLIPGGFIGVDVFFVISGYLITGIIVRETRDGTFSYREFYRRRARRILPAMFAVTFVTLAVGAILLLPDDVEHLAWSSLATATSTANIFFTYFLDTSYFAPDSTTIPLLHMWSLGVEEQFYLLWPLFIVVLLVSRANMLLWFSALVSLSIAVGQWLLHIEQLEWAYYMLPSRAFQLAVGGSLVFLRGPSRRLALLLSAAGLYLIFASAFALQGGSPFPGTNAVPVTVGAAAILAAGARTTPFSILLSTAPLRAFGLISYSLYLWHWPVLAFQRYFYGDLNTGQQVLSFAVITGLAAASYFLIEVPFRRTALPFHRVVASYVAIPMALLGTLVIGLIATNGYGPYLLTDYPERLARAPVAAAPFTLNYVCQRPNLKAVDIETPDCIVGKGEPRILLYGDSNAAHYVGIVGNLAKVAGVSFRNYAHSSCPPIGSDPIPFVSGGRLRACSSSLELVASDLQNYNLIFLGGAWPSYSQAGERNGINFAEKLALFVGELVENGTHVVLLDTVPVQPKFDSQCGRKSLKLGMSPCMPEPGANLPPPTTSELYKLAAVLPHVSVLSVRDEMCRSGQCLVFDDDGTSLYFDSTHFSAEGSWRIGQRLVESAQAIPLIALMRSAATHD